MTVTELIETLKAVPPGTEIRIDAAGGILRLEPSTDREKRARSELRTLAAYLRGRAQPLEDRHVAQSMVDTAAKIDAIVATLL